MACTYDVAADDPHGFNVGRADGGCLRVALDALRQESPDADFCPRQPYQLVQPHRLGLDRPHFEHVDVAAVGVLLHLHDLVENLVVVDDGGVGLFARLV